jgi:hypothetical protein
MPLLGVLELAFQVFFAVHAVRTGRERWLFLIIFFPLIGCLVYIFAEVIPEMRQGSKIRKTRFGAVNTGSPKKRVRFLKDQVEIAPTIQNRKDLAEAYVNTGEFDKAVVIYRDCLKGMNKDNPAIIEGLSCAHFFKGDLQSAKTSLTKLMALRGEKKGDSFDLLLARTFEELGEIDSALKEYSDLLKIFSGEEARCRYGLLLKRLGKIDESKKIFNEIIKNARISPKFYRNTQKKWINIAKASL